MKEICQTIFRHKHRKNQANEAKNSAPRLNVTHAQIKSEIIDKEKENGEEKKNDKEKENDEDKMKQQIMFYKALPKIGKKKIAPTSRIHRTNEQKKNLIENYERCLAW